MTGERIRVIQKGGIGDTNNGKPAGGKLQQALRLSLMVVGCNQCAV